MIMIKSEYCARAEMLITCTLLKDCVAFKEPKVFPCGATKKTMHNKCCPRCECYTFTYNNLKKNGV